MTTSKVLKYGTLTALVVLAALLIGYFKFVVVCILLSVAFAMMGNPLMNLLKKIRIGKFHVGNSLSAGVVLVVLVLLVGLFFYWLFPLLFSEIMQLVNMDTSKIADYVNTYGDELRKLLFEYGIIENKDQAFEVFVNQQLLDLAKGIDIEGILGDVFSITKNILLGLFSVLFLTFFFLKDRSFMKRFIFSAIPDKYIPEMKNVFSSSTNLISRYFIGILCEMILVTLLLFGAFSIAGFPNALLIASICGVMVIIPYLGAIIGSVLSFLILVASILDAGAGIDFFNTLLVFYGIFVGVKLLDDFVMQPLIYSKSVKAHPVEIFLVILIAGQIGGILGMIVAIPAYTLLRILVKEFWSNSKFVKNLVKDI